MASYRIEKGGEQHGEYALRAEMRLAVRELAAAGDPWWMQSLHIESDTTSEPPWADITEYELGYLDGQAAGPNAPERELAARKRILAENPKDDLIG